MLCYQEVKLSTTSAERDLNDSLAEIYSIIVTLDALEKAYLKDSIIEADYTETCSRLLKQYKSNLADETVSKAFGDLESFKREWDVSHATRAIDSLPLTSAAISWNVPAQPNVYGSASPLPSNKALPINPRNRVIQETLLSL